MIPGDRAVVNVESDDDGLADYVCFPTGEFAEKQDEGYGARTQTEVFEEEQVQCEQEVKNQGGAEDEEGSDNDSNVSSRKCKAKATPKSKQINSRCSVKAMRAIVVPFTQEKRDLVKEMEFEGMLALPHIKRSNRKFSLWLFDHVDEMASAIVIDARRDLQFDDIDMHKVMGVPVGGTRIRRNCTKQKEEAVRDILGISKSETRIKVVVDIVAEEKGCPMNKQERNRFKVAFAICAVTYMIAPPPLKNDYFMTDYWGALYTPDLIHKHDWAKFAREEILTTGSRVSGELQGGRKKANLNGCTHALQVYYVDNLDIGEDNIPHTVFPRWKVYSQKFITDIIRKDSKTPRDAPRLICGHLLPRSASSVCYSRNIVSSVVKAGMSMMGEGFGFIEKDQEDILDKIAGVLIDKVTKYATRCQLILQKASDDGAEENRRHSDVWHGIATIANDGILNEKTMLIADIREVTETARRGRKRERSEVIRDDNGEIPVEGVGLDVPMPLSLVRNKRRKGQMGSPSMHAMHVGDAGAMDTTPVTLVRSTQEDGEDPAEANLAELVDQIDREEQMQMVLSADANKDPQYMVPSRKDRVWIYGEHSDMNKNQDQFNLGLDDDLFEGGAHVPLSMIPSEVRHAEWKANISASAMDRSKFEGKGLRKVSLMTEFTDAATPEGVNTEQSIPLTLDNTSINGSQTKGTESGYTINEAATFPGVALSTPLQIRKSTDTVPGPSPVSRNRDMQAALLDAREEIEQDSINLNIIGTDGNVISEPKARRRVKPGKYARSPFVLGYDPPERAPTDGVKIYKMLFKEKQSAMKDVWIISTAPNYVELSAGEIIRMLGNDGVVGNELMTIVMRRYQQMDVLFAASVNEGCWRFFMDPDFANHVSRGDDLTSLKYIEDMFIGDHIKFNVHECTEFVLPVRFNFIWSTYIWDFEKRKIFVLDPTMNNGDESDKIMQTHHRKVADNLHKELEKCIMAFFVGWEPCMTKWRTVFPNGLTHTISRSENSGIYAAHFARNWMGNKLKRGLSQHNDGVTHGRMNMLLDVLGLENNIGIVPERYRSCVVRKEGA